MLTEIRDRSSGWFAWVIAALIIIPMAFWGVNEYATTEANVSIVELGDRKISQADFQNRLNSEQSRVREQMGANVDNDYLVSDRFKQSVLDQMINRTLIDHVAETHNYQVSDEQVRRAIRESDYFQLDGEFNAEAYNRFIQGNRFSKTRYENQVRDDQKVGQITSGFQESALVLPDEVRALLEVQVERRSFDFFTVNRAEYLEKIELSDDEISEYYQANQNSFMQEEQVSVQFLELNLEQIAAGIEIEEEELRALYENNQQAYMSGDSRNTRHILLTTDGDNDDAQLDKANELRQQILAGGDFAALAEEHSEDPGTASTGGSLGMIERGQMVEEFEEAAFSLDVDQISEPVKTQFGYHLIQVVGAQESEQRSFEEVRFELAEEEKLRRAEEELIVLEDRLKDLAYEQPDNLEAAAEQMGVSLQASALFGRNSGDGIAATAAVRSAAFSEEVLANETNSEPIKLDDGNVVVIRKLEHKESQPKPLPEVRAQIEFQLTNQKAAELAANAGASLLAQAKEDWDALLANETVAPTSHTISLIEQDRTLPPSVVQKVATMHLNGQESFVDSTQASNGDFHIVRLTRIEAGDLNAVSDQIKEATRQVLAQRNGQSLVSAYIKSLREELNPEINNEIL